MPGREREKAETGKRSRPSELNGRAPRINDTFERDASKTTSGNGDQR